MKNITEKDVAIIIPLPNKTSFSEAEKISVQHLITFLGKYDKYFVIAENFKSQHIELDGFQAKRFPDKFFGSILAHNKLLTNKLFYKAFSKYKYILMYHLDSLVFSDKLLYWCEKDFDCIAPPWLKADSPWLDKSGVGNGGFSLRKVESMIKLYSSKKYWHPPAVMAKKSAEKVKSIGWLIYPFAWLTFKIRWFNNINLHLKKYLLQKWSAEDRFIAVHGNHYYPELKIASVDEALKFAFEKNPKESFLLNDEEMPFGCHAYERYDFAFWEPHLIEPEVQMVEVNV